MVCRSCGAELSGTKTAYCNENCQRKFLLSTYGGAADRPAVLREKGSNILIGTIGELVTATDLLSRGLEVFRALNHRAICDLVVLSGEIVGRVEVKSGYRLPSGRINWQHAQARRVIDMYAVVMSNHDVVYVPVTEGGASLVSVHGLPSQPLFVKSRQRPGAKKKTRRKLAVSA